MLLLIFSLLLSHTLAQVITADATADLSKVSIFAVDEQPSTTAPTSIAVKAAQFTHTGNTATAQGAAFKVVEPDPTVARKDCGFYFGYFSAVASITIGTGLTNTGASISTSLVELVAGLRVVYLYVERNGVPGFQPDLNNLICALAVDPTKDCWNNTSDVIDVGSLAWNPIVYSSTSCSAGCVACTSYSANCTVNILTLQSTNGVVTLKFKLASQPIYVDGYHITPDYGKIDIMIRYPYTTGVNSNLRVGILVATAGKTADSSLTITPLVAGSKNGVLFNSQGHVGAFSWDTTAMVTTSKRQTSSTVYHSEITGDAMLAYQCSGNVILCLGLLGFTTAIKAEVFAWQAFQWKVTYLFFSWDAPGATLVSWDPTIGNSPSSSSVERLMCHQTLLLITLIVFLFHKWM